MAVVGVGSTLRGDDAAGMLAAEALQRTFKARRNGPQVAVFLGETAPENLTGEIRRFQPTHVVILDAADVGAAPGHIEVIPNDAPTRNPTISTHSLPMKVFTDFLTKSIGCQAVVAGIQPATREFGRPVSAAVKRAAHRLAAALAAVLSE